MSLAGPFLFDPRAFWGDENVRLMTGEQVAAYLKILSLQWENGSVPADPRRLACLMSDGARSYSTGDLIGSADSFTAGEDGRFEGTLEAPLEGSLWENLQPCFRVAEGRLINDRLAEEREAWVEKKEKMSAGGKKGGRRSAKARSKGVTARKPHSSPPSSPPSKAGSSQASPSSPSSSSTSDTTTKKKEAATGNGKPKRKARVNDLSYSTELLRIVPDFQKLWLESRKKRKLGSKTTPSAEQSQIDELTRWAVEFGAEAVRDEIKKANLGSYQGICFREPGQGNGGRRKSTSLPAGPNSSGADRGIKF